MRHIKLFIDKHLTYDLVNHILKSPQGIEQSVNILLLKKKLIINKLTSVKKCPNKLYMR